MSLKKSERNPDFRALPSIGMMMETERGRRLSAEHGRSAASSAISDAIGEMRKSGDFSADSQTNAEAALLTAEERLSAAEGSPKRVINATGIPLHTNLGRAPLSGKAAMAALRAAEGYTNLEYDLSNGKRGSRQVHVADGICRLIGCEAAMVVNNNAAAVLLCLDALTKGGKVAVSRGELVEIGGSFRVPEIMSATGAILVEVGTTNRTRAMDFEKAAAEGAVALLKVHPSNFKVSGFVSEASVKDMAAIASEHHIPLIYDIGSGSLIDTESFGLPHEPMPSEAIRDGADLVTFSADKLMGGPQCGIIAGKTELIRKLSKSPLARAFRVDKMRLAALAATISQYERVDGWRDIPALQMMREDRESIKTRARLAASAIKEAAKRFPELAGLETELAQTQDEIGGGSLPEAWLEGAGVRVSLAGVSPQSAASALRSCKFPVIALERGGELLFALRTVTEEEVGQLAFSIAEAFAAAKAR